MKLKNQAARIFGRIAMTSACRLLLCILIIAAAASAQDRGTIAGTVTDPSGGAIGGAKATLTNPDTGLTQTATSATDGIYNFASLSAGRYNVTLEKDGFQKAQSVGVEVEVNTSTRLDVKLVVGTVAQTVQIQSSAPLLQTDRSDLGRVIDKQAIQDLPLFANGGLRSNIAFATLSPGVITSLTSDPDTTGGAPRIAGGTSGSNTSLLLDGGETQSQRRNDPQMRVVSADGIEEFKVQTGAYSAEYGRSSNGILNYTTKSGTNDFRGSAFLVIRNQDLNANGFFYTFPPPGSQTIHNQNLEALTIGGPVWVPKVYNGKNKAFFFFSGERSRAKDIVSNSLISLPTAAFRTGNFSAYTAANGSMIPIYDPGDPTGGTLANNGGIIPNANSRVPFPGNIIPLSRQNPVALLIQNDIPLPANPNSVFNNNPVVNTGARDPGENQGVYAIKGDFNPTDKLRLSGLFSRQYFNGCQICMGPMPGPLGEGFQEFFDNKYVHFNADYIVSPNLLNHFTFAYNKRGGGEAGNERLGPNTSGFGLATEVPGDPSYSKAPNYTWYGFQNYPNTSSFVQTNSPGQTFDFKDGVTWQRGRQSVKFGFEFIRQNYARSDCNGCGGELSFTSAATGNPGVSTSGLDYASFLLGVANSGFFNYNGNINYVYPYYAAYFQDDIKLTAKLTLNVGLRYDLPLARREPNGQSSNFSATALNPAAGNLPGALIFAGSGPGRTGLSSLLQHRSTAFGPRFGFAYQLNSKTVIRAGGAIMYDSNREDGNADGGVQGFGGNYNVPSNYFSTGVAVLLPSGSNAPVAGFTPFAGPIAAGAPPVVNPSIVNFGSPSYFSDGKGGQLYDYNFTVERTLSAATLLRASFHANYGNEIQSSQNYNQLNPKYIGIYGSLLTSPLSTIMATPAQSAVLAANGYQLPYAGYPLNNTLSQSLDPYPQYSQGFGGTTNGGHSTFNALETSLQHNFAGGLFAQISYTWSKWFADNTSPNVYAASREKDLSSADRPHVLTLAYVYDLPLGRGRRFGGNMQPVLDAVIGGWKASAVQHYQSGTVIGVSCGQNLYGAGSARCNYVAGQPLYNANWNPNDPHSPYINAAAFTQPANGVFGNLGAVVPGLRNPIQMDEDVALSKIFRFGEKRTLEFRASAFNIANRHLLGSFSSTSITSSTFAQITNPQSNQPRNVEGSLRFRF
jgi:hypothetical protein